MPRPYTAQTLIAEAVKEEPDLVDRLVAWQPSLARLSDPVLRANVGRLVTFEDVARIAGVPVAALLAQVDNRELPARAGPSPASGDAVADLPDVDAYVDVRSLLARGEAPIGEVLRAAAGIPPGGTLVVDAPFDPAPLRRMLNNQGFSDRAVCLNPGHWRIVFRRAAPDPPPRPDDEENPAPEQESRREWEAADGVHIDVRGLEPPQPMLNILELVDSGRAGDVVTVHHEREPVYLYPELLQRGWTYRTIEGEPDEVRIRLLRRAS
jgi:hypothetical protein